jgi:anaphase-promoting complex subunit 1
MFTLSTVHPLPTSPLSIPTLNLNGRAPPRNSSVGLDRVDKPPDMTKWAEFHNGVAAGLQLAHGSSKVGVYTPMCC